MDSPTVTSTLDCRGMVCPMPVLKLSQAVKVLPPGSLIELLATDPGSVPDLEAFERRTGHRVVARSEADGVFRFLVERAP